MRMNKDECTCKITKTPLVLDISKNSEMLKTQVLTMFKMGMDKQKIVHKLYKEKFFTYDDEKREKIIEKYMKIVSNILKEAGLA